MPRVCTARLPLSVTAPVVSLRLAELPMVPAPVKTDRSPDVPEPVMPPPTPAQLPAVVQRVPGSAVGK